MTMLVEDFDYELPPELIAAVPAEKRDGARMLLVDRSRNHLECGSFADISRFFKKGDLLVVNNTKVIRARFFGFKMLPDGIEGQGAKIEILLLTPEHGESLRWRCMAKPGKRLKAGASVRLLDLDGQLGDVCFDVLDVREDGLFVIEFKTDLGIEEIGGKYGHMPLPPYIRRADAAVDGDRYQTVYAKELGAVAAPTAGLHFTPEMIDILRNRGVDVGEVTLHVGAGTFKPVSVERIEDHNMHSEEYELSPETADKINAVKQAGGRIFAVGTTVVRTLETLAEADGTVKAGKGSTNIFIHPPYRFKVIDKLLTNFHLPKSTLLMLVSAFAGKELTMRAYEMAIENRFRFYSYGDCMLIL